MTQPNGPAGRRGGCTRLNWRQPWAFVFTQQVSSSEAACGDLLGGVAMLLEHHRVADEIDRYISISTNYLLMAKRNEHVNRNIDRTEVEELQTALFRATRQALDQAATSGEIPASLLQAATSLLRDFSIAPDMTQDPEDGESLNDVVDAVKPTWLDDI